MSLGREEEQLGEILSAPPPKGLHLPIRPEGGPPPPFQGHRDSLSEEPEAEREALPASPSSRGGGVQFMAQDTPLGFLPVEALRCGMPVLVQLHRQLRLIP